LISLETARTYFGSHLLGEVFLESGETLMSAALTMASSDIDCRLAAPAEETDPCYIAAVCEQAVFLLTRRERLADNQTLLSESVEGLGSRSYSAPENGDTVLAPRARLYLASLNAGKTAKITRG